jgi:hypothetical protein
LLAGGVAGKAPICYLLFSICYSFPLATLGSGRLPFPALETAGSRKARYLYSSGIESPEPGPFPCGSGEIFPANLHLLERSLGAFGLIHHLSGEIATVKPAPLIGRSPDGGAGYSQPTAHPLPVGIVFRPEVFLEELFFERDQPKVDYPEKKNRRNEEPKRFDGE